MMKHSSVPILRSAARRCSMPQGNATSRLLIRLGNAVRYASASATPFRPLSAHNPTNLRRVLPPASSSYALMGQHTKASEDARGASTISHSLSAPNGSEARQPESDLVVVLDMDECLIHSQFFTAPPGMSRGINGSVATTTTAQYRQDEEGRPSGNTFGQSPDEARCENLFSSEVVDYFRFVLPDGDLVRVNKRPYVDQFLQRISSKYETYVFTAAVDVYASPVLDRLDPTNSMIRKRFYRESCTLHGGTFVKDLRHILPSKDDEDVVFQQEQQFRRKMLGVSGKRQGQQVNGAPVNGSEANDTPRKEDQRPTVFDERRVVLVDNNPLSFLANPSNGILVSSFYDDPTDDTLWAVADLLDQLDQEEDVRPFLDDMFGLRSALREAMPQMVERMPMGEEEYERAALSGR